MSKYAITSLLAISSIALPVVLLGAGCQPDASTNVNQSADTEVTTPSATETAVTETDSVATVTVPVDEVEVMEDDTADVTEESVTETDITATAETVTVSTVGNTFSPATVTIAAGDSVEFTLGAAHNVVEVAQSTWESSASSALSGGFSIGFGGTETVTFDEPGTYYYVCAPHVALGMKGMIVVE